MKNLITFALLLFACVTFASLTPPSCVPVYSLLGGTFMVQPSANISCNGNTSLLYGITTNGQWSLTHNCAEGIHGGVGLVGGRVKFQPQIAADCGGGAQSPAVATIQMPISGNYTFSYFGGASDTFGGASIAGTSTGTLIDYNSTHYQVNAASTSYVPKGGAATISIAMDFGTSGCACTQYGSMPYVSIDSYTLNNPAGFATTGTSTGLGVSDVYYYGYYNNALTITDIMTGSNVSPILAPSAPMRALVYYGDRAIIPLITYSPTKYAFPVFYNSSNGVAFLNNNTVMYILDNSTLQWYIVPAFSVNTYADTLSLGTILWTGSAPSVSSSIILPVALSCTRSSNNLAISSQFQNSGTHIVTYGNSTNMSVYSLIGTTFAYSVDLSTAPIVNYTFDGITYCSSANANTTLLGLNVVTFPNYFKPIGYIFFIGALGISAVVPFALIFPVMMNDAFSYMSVIQMAIIICVVGVISAFVNHRGELSMKSLGVYLMFAMALLMYFFSAGSLTGVTDPSTGTAYFASLQSAFKSFSDIIYGNSTSQAIGLFAIPAVAVNLLVQLAIFFVTLPITFTSMMMSMIGMVSSPLYSAIKMLYLDTALAVGATAFMLLKLYEVISNRFRGV
jgi:hypothetical protein